MKVAEESAHTKMTKQYICSYELAKALSEYKIDQYFIPQLYWQKLKHLIEHTGIYEGEIPEQKILEVALEITPMPSASYPDNVMETYPAWLVTDLLEILPKEIIDNEFYGGTQEAEYGLRMIWEENQGEKQWVVEYYRQYYDYKDYLASDKNLANALAKMALYLLDQKLLVLKKETENELHNGNSETQG
jgi:hypothetical protein